MSKIKILLLSALGLAVLLFVSFYVLGQYSKSGQAAGTVDGALSRCSVKPNCVCSEYADDVAHYIEPVAGMSNAAEFDLLEVQSIIKDMGGEVQRADEHYVAAVFSSLVFGFVEIAQRYLQAQQKCQLEVRLAFQQHCFWRTLPSVAF